MSNSSSVPSHASSRENPDNLAQFDRTPGQLADIVFQTQEVLLIHLLVEFFVDGVHVLLVALVVFCTLALHLLDVIAVLADVNIVRCTLYSQVIDFVAKLVDVALLLSTGALQPTDAEVQGIQTLGSLFCHIRMVALNAIRSIIDLLMHVLILLAKVCLDLVGL